MQSVGSNPGTRVCGWSVSPLYHTTRCPTVKNTKIYIAETLNGKPGRNLKTNVTIRLVQWTYKVCLSVHLGFAIYITCIIINYNDVIIKVMDQVTNSSSLYYSQSIILNYLVRHKSKGLRLLLELLDVINSQTPKMFDICRG